MLDTSARARLAHPARDFQAHLADLEVRGLLVRIDRPNRQGHRASSAGALAIPRRLRKRSGAPSCSPTWLTADGRRYDIPVAVGALPASPRSMRRHGRAGRRDRRAWMRRHRASHAAGRGRRAAMPGGRDLGADARAPGGGSRRCRCRSRRRASTPRPILRRRSASPSDPDSGVRTWEPIGRRSRPLDRLGVRMVARPRAAPAAICTG